MGFRTVINGMGGITESSPGVFQTTGMTDAGVMNVASNFIENPGVNGIANDSMKVTQTSPASNEVEIAPGSCYVENNAYVVGGDELKYWEVNNDTAVQLEIPANASGNPRIDLICVKVDPLQTPGDDGAANCSYVVVQGTPAGSPVAPAIPAKHTVLAQVAVANGFSTITSVNITDRRLTPNLKVPALPEGILINGKISVSVASNNITVALKTLTGNDPSLLDPVKITIGGVLRTITSALSVTKNAGTNWFNSGSTELATREVDYFVYLGYNATDGVVIGFARRPDGTQYSSFNTTATNQNYCAISTITNAASGDPYTNIGRFAATLSAGAGHTWTIPTFTPANLIQKPIYETRELSSSSTITAPSGSFTTIALTAFAYKLIGNILYITGTITNTTNGTAVGLLFTLPWTSLTVAQFGINGREDASTGTLLQGRFNSTSQISMLGYDNSTTPINANGRIIRFKGYYNV